MLPLYKHSLYFCTCQKYRQSAEENTFSEGMVEFLGTQENHKRNSQALMTP